MRGYVRFVAWSTVTLAIFAALPLAVADDWINLFDNETLFGWTPQGDAQLQVADKNLVCDGGSGGWLATTSEFADFELTAKVRLAAGASCTLIVRAPLDGHPSENGASFLILAEPEKTTPDWREVSVKADGANVTATVGGKEATVAVGANKVGHVGIAYHRTGKVEVASLRLRPINVKPLFNGKDLTGWNIIPKHKSEFAVVDGAINIKNGNGQIETAGTFKDFIVQLDIFSNGDHLNSGVFYRTPVGVFWKGYEAQVRNQWEGDNRNKPVDFGTGGNYGNQAARKVVSSDREWYTMTIVCNGDHAGIWVNGYLTSDYLDARPVSKDPSGKEAANGKEGYVAAAGTINLQGHDPTTDLSFKNINIQEYPAK